ncbi:DUF397 domain-containing protein [Streptomyces sp. HSW2009]|uniref:DUF397 domain-containing protein n=1 Tax=Streptomyces sp. HSW2009 TaxID=3142890 RepID=UPI0032EEFC61
MTTNNGRFLTAPELEGASWVKSSYSGDSQGQCIEVADLAATSLTGMRGIRDSKNPDGPALLLSADAFADFVSGIKNGEFDI